MVQGQGNPLIRKLKLELVLKGVSSLEAEPEAGSSPNHPKHLSKNQTGAGHYPRIQKHVALGSLAAWDFCFCATENLYFPISTHITPADVAVDSHLNPSLVAVRMKRSKKQFGEGATIYLGKTAEATCPVTAILRYLAIRSILSVKRFKASDKEPNSSEKFNRPW